MRTFLSTLVAVACVFAAIPVGNAQAPDLPKVLRPGVSTTAAPARVTAARATTVFGFVWNAKNEPIPHATVQLRNVATGFVEARTVAAENGEFTFSSLEGGTYVIEYIEESGKVLAVGHVFSVSPGETVATFIRLGSTLPWYASLLGSAGSVAATAVSTAAGLGVTALAPGGRSVSPEG